MSEYATIPKDIAQTVIPTDDGWPRSVFTITTTTEDQQSKRLLVFDQESAQQNYKLMAMARLFEGCLLYTSLSGFPESPFCYVCQGQ